MSKEMIYAFIKERSASNIGTKKISLQKEFPDLSIEEIQSILKELIEENKICLCPLFSESTGLLSGSGYLSFK